MHWLQELDVGLLRFINQTLSNSFFDVLMPFASGNKYFFPAVFLAGGLLLWKGGARGRLCILMLAVILPLGDAFICNGIKHVIGRPRPFLEFADIHVLVGRGRAFSMPSSHAANMFATAMIFFVYYRRSAWFMVPLAGLVAYSRVYNGVHYPSDALAGAILGAGYAVAGMWALNALWQWAGRKWFPLWWAKCPSLIHPQGPAQKEAETSEHTSVDQHWLRLGYVTMGVLLFVRLAYIHGGLELTGDEAYQWTWSKHPALSYISKPPLIAYAQWVGTHLWGDTEFGVRFFSPVIGAVLTILLLRFFAREVNARAGYVLLWIVQATPLMALGSVLMTVDPLLVLFWTAATVAGWRAIQPGSKTSAWLWVGLWMGLGLLSKYTEALQWACWIVLFALWKPARAHLRRPGPWLALAISGLFLLPLLIWNAQHDWSGVDHLANHNAGLDKPWRPTFDNLLDFLLFQSLLLNPVFFVGMVWASIAFWRRSRNDARLVYLFSMGAPVMLGYLLYSFHIRILPNWTVPAVLPLFSLMVIYWDGRWQSGRRAVKGWLITGLALGLTMVVVAHDSDLIKRVTGKPLPSKADPLTRARAYGESAKVIDRARRKLLAEGKPVFIIAGHYQTTALATFYLPEAKTNVTGEVLVYVLSPTNKPDNQFHYWPGYRERRRGQNAIYVRELSLSPLDYDWPLRWLRGETNLSEYPPRSRSAPTVLLEEFESVTDLGQFNALYGGRVFHVYQLFECRNLR